MAWHKTSDGSFLDHSGKVLFFSKDRFVNDICLGRCCFICGAQPGSKVFNDEHVIPEWVLRKFNLFNRAITLPNGGTVKYGRFKVPCCQDCNSLMGRQIEERISKVVNAGPEAVQKHIAEGNGLEFFVWLGLISRSISRTGSFEYTTIFANRMTRSETCMTGRHCVICTALCGAL